MAAKSFTMSFQNLVYVIKQSNKSSVEEKAILNGVSGQFKSGEITAIMGRSGSGKTSLLNFLNGRLSKSDNSIIEGDIYINSDKINQNKVINYSGYVMQDDILFPFLTPYENVKLATELRKAADPDKFEESINKTLSDLGLMECKDTLIGGGASKGVSGGEKKRTSIAMELVSNPSILFLDEPTSGLDSLTSYTIINLLKTIASTKNIMVICTIHQPSSNIFNIFDHLMILDKGSIIYNDLPSSIIPYFKSIDRPLISKYNPADAFMQIIKQEEKSTLLLDSYNSLFTEKIKCLIESTLKIGLLNDLRSKKEGRAGFMESTWILSQRCYYNLIRNPLQLKIKILFTVIFSVLVSMIFWQISGQDYDAFYTRVGVIFYLSINVFSTQTAGTVLSFPSERVVFTREYSSRLYSAESYFLSKNLVETPISLILSVLYVAIIYFTSGLRLDNDISHFWIFMAAFTLHTLVSQSFGYLIGTIFSESQSALNFINLLIQTVIVFSGVIINESSMPIYIFWMKYLSPLKYVSEIGITNELKGNPNVTNSESSLNTMNYSLGVEACFIVIGSSILVLRLIAMLFLKFSVRNI